MPISGLFGVKVLKKCTDMVWWTCARPVPPRAGRPTDAPMRMLVSGNFLLQGFGDWLAGRVQQGAVVPGEEVVLLPTHAASNPRTAS